MPEYLAPGVFIEEIDSGSKPIEGVGTNTAAFVGYAKSGEFNKPTFIANWTQFCQIFGEEENAIVKALCDELGLTAADVVAAKRASRKGWMEFAMTAVTSAIRERQASGKTDPEKAKTWPDFLKKYQIPQGNTPYLEGSYLAHAVRGYYDNGGSRAYIVRIARPEDIAALSYAPASAAAGQPASVATATVSGITFRALKPGAEGNDIKVEVEAAEGDEFRVKVSKGTDTEQFGYGKDKPLTVGTLADALKKSKLVEAEVTATATKPAARVYTLTGGAEALVPAGPGTALTPAGTALAGSLAKVSPADFIGDEAQRTGFNGLATVEDINMIAVPDLMAGVFTRVAVPGSDGPGEEVLTITDERKQAILDAQCALVAYCERMADRMAILDPIPGLTPQEMRDTTNNTPYNCDHGQAAIYYPWIKIVDPTRKGAQMFCPPSGHVAGVWARVGVERGVHKAPANEALLGAVALETSVTKAEQEILNPDGINAIRSFPGTGIRIWGARTLATVGNPSWKYVNVRRLFNYLEKSMERGLQWVVFEPNDEDLWGRVRRNLSAFLWTEWKEGKLFGSVPEEAFYVKCDAETNPQEMIDLGRLYVEIGVNPVKPAEFVIIRIGQWSGGGSISEG